MADVSRQTAKNFLKLVTDEPLGAKDFFAFNQFLLEVSGGDLGENDIVSTERPETLVRKALAVLDGASITLVD